jgi:cytochrome c-type biogenesis protein CcmF
MTSNSFVVLEGLNKDIDRAALQLGDSDIAVSAKLKVEDINKNTYYSQPLFVIKNFEVNSKESILDTLGLKFAFNKIDPATGKIDISVSEKKSNKKAFIIMKAIIFPGINILWTGCLLMIVGTIITIRKRIKQAKSLSNPKT